MNRNHYNWTLPDLCSWFGNLDTLNTDTWTISGHKDLTTQWRRKNTNWDNDNQEDNIKDDEADIDLNDLLGEAHV